MLGTIRIPTEFITQMEIWINYIIQIGEISLKKLPSETFCVLPFMHAAISPTGSFRVCCNNQKIIRSGKQKTKSIKCFVMILTKYGTLLTTKKFANNLLTVNVLKHVNAVSEKRTQAYAHHWLQ